MIAPIRARSVVIRTPLVCLISAIMSADLAGRPAPLDRIRDAGLQEAWERAARDYAMRLVPNRTSRFDDARFRAARLRRFRQLILA